MTIALAPLQRLTGNGIAQKWAPLMLVMLGAVLVRLAAAFVLRQPLESDALSYFIMASGLAEHGVLFDNFGQHVFYSAGYPLILAPFFVLLGSSISTGLAVNFALAIITLWLIHALALAITRRRDAALLAALGYALWLPAIWNATVLAKENLSTPLLLGVALCAVQVARGERAQIFGFVGGLVWGAGLITGGSSLLLCLGMAVALLCLWRTGAQIVPPFRAGLCFALGGLLMLAPWLSATNAMVGRPVLTTNTAFNLYLGNNPAATGRFVSIADTPMGEGWEQRRIALGEVGTADLLQREANEWMMTHPGEAMALAGRKLVYFWQPNLPDAVDIQRSAAIAAIRIIDVAQYLALAVLGLWAFRSREIAGGDKAILAAMLAGFWLIHAAAYIIPRYRDPAMPLLILLAALPVANFIHRRSLRYAA